ncbi:uncharacterized protein LOC128963301 [Oppia nitens]|uniref:uncharacterized protein LOC128963301 n=1 Tax=Oppia nitens TaxID=1686743 RepID=UPI0023DABF1D|nr:uncharacterized protein LOC128963301 [Oppia nitens]
MKLLVIYLCILYIGFISADFSGPTTRMGEENKERWLKFHALSAYQKVNKTLINNVCGHWSEPVKCFTKIGRSTDAEMVNCDRYCCSRGFVTGFCNRHLGLDSDVGGVSINLLPVKLYLSSNCLCTNSWTDSSCGLDGSFLGIRCPDKSACRRKCCRNGKTGGHCSGFLRLKCKCD